MHYADWSHMQRGRRRNQKVSGHLGLLNPKTDWRIEIYWRVNGSISKKRKGGTTSKNEAWVST